MAKVNLITQAEYAKHRGVSEAAVSQAVSAGRISLIDGRIDPAVADIQWARNTRARQSNQPAVAAPGESQGPRGVQAGARDDVIPEPDYAAFRARRERADALIAEMTEAKMSGAMLMREDVDRAIFEVAREIRDRLTACARRIASEVAAIPTAEGCEAVIDREHRIVLELLVTRLRAKGQPGEHPSAA